MTIPKLQLQQSGICVQAMNPEQIRAAIDALPSEDRVLLTNNIQLLHSCTNKEDLQSVISFIDPLALCMAVKSKPLKNNLIEAASVMTKEQIRIIVPLLSVEDISQLGKVLEEDNLIDLVLSMIDKPSQLSQYLLSQLPELKSNFQSTIPKIEALKAQIADLETRIDQWKTQPFQKETFDILSRALKTIKPEIENTQISLRNLQRSCVLPRKCSNVETFSNLGEFQTLYSNLGDLTKSAHNLFSELDKLMAKLNESLRPITTPDYAASPRLERNSPVEDSIYSDDRAIILHEAIKQIGNPDAIGTHYSMTWDDIIRGKIYYKFRYLFLDFNFFFLKGGFRTISDFHSVGITSLDQLQKYLKEKSIIN